MEETDPGVPSKLLHRAHSLPCFLTAPTWQQLSPVVGEYLTWEVSFPTLDCFSLQNGEAQMATFLYEILCSLIDLVLLLSSPN